MLRCLTQKKDEIKSEACRKEVFYFEKMEVSNYHNDVILAAQCRADVDKFCKDVPPGEPFFLFFSISFCFLYQLFTWSCECWRMLHAVSLQRLQSCLPGQDKFTSPSVACATACYHLAACHLVSIPHKMLRSHLQLTWCKGLSWRRFARQLLCAECVCVTVSLPQAKAACMHVCASTARSSPPVAGALLRLA